MDVIVSSCITRMKKRATSVLNFVKSLRLKIQSNMSLIIFLISLSYFKWGVREWMSSYGSLWNPTYFRIDKKYYIREYRVNYTRNIVLYFVSLTDKLLMLTIKLLVYCIFVIRVTYCILNYTRFIKNI